MPQPLKSPLSSVTLFISLASFSALFCLSALVALTSGCKVTPQAPSSSLSIVDQTIGRAAQIETLVAQTDLILQTTAETARKGGVLAGADFLHVQSYTQQIAQANDISIEKTREAIGTGKVGSIPQALLAEAALIGQNPKIDNTAITAVIQTLLDLAQQIQALPRSTISSY